MKNRTVGLGLTTMLLVASGSAVYAQDRLLHQGTEPGTGATMRIYRTKAGSRIDVETKTMLLRKEAGPSRVTTTIRSGRESMVITVTPDRLEVTGTRGTASASPANQQGLVKAQRIVADSPLSARAAELIARMKLPDVSPLHPMLLTTRAFLLAARGEDAGTRELSAWSRRAAPGVRVVKASVQSRTPTECWNDYNKELVEAWGSYEDCMDNVKWWNPFGSTGCTLKYEFRVVAAFTWYLDCVKLLSFITG